MTTTYKTLGAFAAMVALVAGVGCSADPGSDETTGDVNPSASTSDALTMPKCGTALASFDGTTAFSNAANTGTGVSCAGWGQYGLQYQCVELVQRHFKTHWGLSWSGNAKDLLNNAPKATVDVYANGDAAHPPVPGDMIVWKNGYYGHVALITAVHSNAIDIIEQNVGGSGSATLTYSGGTVGARWGSWVPAGWAHAKANGGSSNNNPPPPPVNNPPPNNPPSGWSCSNSSYAGNQYWTCSGSARFKCVSGNPVTETCANGCQSEPAGTDDVCKSAPPPPPPPVNWSCSKSAYAGNQYWTCSGNARFKCTNGVPQTEVCSNSCQSKPVGTDDVCL